MQGLRVYSNNGALQIDSKYQNMVLTGSGSAVASAGGIARYVDVNVNGINPLLAFRHAYGVTCVPINKVGSTFTFRLYTYYQSGSIGDLNIYYWVFDSIAASSSSSHGLRVYNESGAICYDSGEKYLKILEGNFTSASTTYPGKSILTVPCVFGYNVSWTPAPNLNFFCRNDRFSFVKVTGSDTAGFFNTQVSFNCAFTSPGQPFSTGGTFAVIDVTGYGI